MSHHFNESAPPPESTCHSIKADGPLLCDEDEARERTKYSHGDEVERKRTQEAIRLRDRAMSATTQGIIITDPNQPGNPIVYVNPSFERITGYSASEVMGRNCRCLQGPETDRAVSAQISAAIRDQQSCNVVILNYRKDGTTFWNELSISPVRDDDGNLTHFVGVQTDVTQRRRTEEELRQSQKMEALGRLVGGIAHDFNNMLTAINGYSVMLLNKQLPPESFFDVIREIHMAGHRAADLTRKLLTFGRQQGVSPEPVNLNDVINETVSLLKHVIGDDIEVIQRADPNLRSVMADRSQMSQIVMNLALNARDAMPLGGRLVIETRHLDGPDITHLPSLPRCDVGYAQLTVTDTGQGMTEQVKSRIFEPFFTTKPLGKGTGLGLSTVHGIVMQSGGDIRVTSDVNKGTTFTIHLPSTDQSETHDAATTLSSSAYRGTETVLVVEDELVVRRLIATVLKLSGYTVLEAGDGEQALRIVTDYPAEIAMILSDVTMPGSNGHLLVKKVKEMRPGIRAVVMSACADGRTCVAHETAPVFLAKPISPVDLRRTVRQLLDQQ